MHGVDLLGADGGKMAAAALAGAGITAGGAIPVLKWFWDKFGDKRIEALTSELAVVKAAREKDRDHYEEKRREDRLECRRETQELRARISDLERLLIQYGGNNRNAIQAAISETNARVTEVAHGAYKIEGPDAT